MRERELDPSASPAAFFGNEVREARTAAKMSQVALGSATGYDATYVSKIEHGHIVPDGKFLSGIDHVFRNMNGWFSRFWRDSRKWNGHYREWFKVWVATERQASVIRWYEPMLIPGLVQTEDYAGEVLSWGPLSGNVDDDVQARMDRQEILNRDDPPELWVLLAESAVCRRVGNAEIMRGQLKHLAELSRRPNITVQVVPDDADAYGGLSGGFAVATVEPAGSLVYLETGLRGMTSDDPMMVKSAGQMFEHLRAEALAKRPTFDLLAEVGERWKG
jgi:transcriptional regulator with XRE-family HTH domain